MGGNVSVRPNDVAAMRRKLAVVAVLAVVLFGVATARIFVAPDLPPLPAHVDAIIELAGPGIRDAATMALVHQGLAPVVVQSTTQQEDGKHTCLPATPGVEVLCFNPKPGTTRGEAHYIAATAAQRHWKSIIIVTTPDHALRARLRVGRCFPGTVYVAESPLPWLYWFRQIPYQWTASVKALAFQTAC